MIDLILLILNFALFLVGFAFTFIQLLKFKPNQEEHTDIKKLPKYSKYSLGFSLLSLLVMVFLSFF